MGDTKRFHSLTFKLMAVVIVAAVAAVVTFVVVFLLGGRVVDRVFLSEEATQARLDQQIASFRAYVAQEQIHSADVNAVEAWNREHLSVELIIYGVAHTINSTAAGASLVGNDSGLVIRSEELTRGGAEYPVNFRDGSFSVAVFDHSGSLYGAALAIVALVMAALVFLVMLLLYDQHITRTVQTLSRQVRQVSRGDLQMQIQPITKDEIGQLAQDVDTMRLSIIDKLQREEAAWQANSQLITAISHDVRTPLTALLGYLELLSDETASPQERQAYLEICKNNANRLKSLTDELFGFFLVFGRPTPEQQPEEFDAATLLEQILLEQELGLNQRGLQVQMIDRQEKNGKIRVDLSHLRRIFDNLFSNVSKYADYTRPVTILRKTEGDDLSVSISNYVPGQTARVESNRIGLKTCEKLVSAMGGEFYQRRTRDTFTVEIILPMIPE